MSIFSVMKLFWIGIFAIVLGISCKVDRSSESAKESFGLDDKEAPRIDRTEILGFWIVDTALKNQGLVNTLHGMFFQIKPDTIVSNLTGDTLINEVDFDPLGKFVTKSKDSLIFNIVNYDSTRIVLKSIIDSNQFDIILKKI